MGLYKRKFCTAVILTAAVVCSNDAMAVACKLAFTSDTLFFNTCIGTGALSNNNTGIYNSALGFQALFSNTIGNYNSALGSLALYSNTTGRGNVSIGVDSLVYNTTGNDNSAMGSYSLFNNTIGNGNSSLGYSALVNNTTGNNNSAIGIYSLSSNTTGSNNIAIGYYAGFNLTTGSNDVDIANAGVAGESGVIRIGTQGTQNTTFLSGIYGSAVAGATVFVNSSGQLGVAPSSRRYKEDIKPMGSVSDKLLELHPVTFHYKKADEEGKKPIQYGLIAEEVEEVMPELVVRNKDGSPETVAYQYISSLLLNEYQKQHKELVDEKAALAIEKAELSETKAKLTSIEAKEKNSEQQISELKSQVERLNAITKKLMAALPSNTKTAMAK